MWISPGKWSAMIETSLSMAALWADGIEFSPRQDVGRLVTGRLSLFGTNREDGCSAIFLLDVRQTTCILPFMALLLGGR